MDKSEIVRVLQRIGIAMELEENNPFEIMAFKNGAEHLDDWDGDLEQAVADGTLTDIYGIGKGLATVIGELVNTGRCERYDEICLKYPLTLFDLFKVSGLGTSKIKKLNRTLGVDSLDSLEAAAKAGQIRSLPGFGAKTEERILRNVEYARRKL